MFIPLAIWSSPHAAPARASTLSECRGTLVVILDAMLRIASPML
jgi:hypothetical protein